MINYAKRVAALAVATVAIVVPLFNYAPRFYEWMLLSQTRRLYRRLRGVETQLNADALSPAQAAALQTELDSIGRTARVLPIRHSDLFFALIAHVEVVRARLVARLAELRDHRRVA
jgi:hypothetical protein